MIVFHRKISTNPVVETSYWLPTERANLPASLFLRYLGRIIPGWDPAERLRPSGGPVSARSQHHRRARRCKGNHLHRRIRPIHSRPGSRGLGYPGASLWIHSSSPASHRRCRARIQRLDSGDAAHCRSRHPRPGKPDRESWTRRLSSAGETRDSASMSAGPWQFPKS